MSQTLYRKYRPQQFSEVVGRENTVRTLAEELRSGSVAHAYLFTGIRGTGKTSLARIFAKALNCTARDKKTSEPCLACDSCVAIQEGRSSDLIEIDAASNRRIDEIRQLREQVRYVPASSLYKVYIIDEVHMLTTEAFNALLKTLEEPPEHVIFILASTELHKIPDTIFSRCQHFGFGKLSFGEITGRIRRLAELEKVLVVDTVIEDVARRAGGSLRDAESLLGQIISIGKKKITEDDAQLFLPKVGFDRAIGWIGHLLRQEAAPALESLAELEAAGVNLEFFLQESLAVARQLLLFVATHDRERLALSFSASEIQQLEELASVPHPAHLRRTVVELLKASQDAKHSPDLPILPLEIAVIVICEEPVAAHRQQVAPAAPLGKAPAERSIEAMLQGAPSAGSVLEQKSPAAKKEKQPSPEKTVCAADGVARHTLEEILDGWGEVLAKVKNKNQALNFVLGVAEPVAVSGSRLELGFKYKLQQEKVSEFKNREIVETIIQEVYGSSYSIEPTVREDINTGARLSAGAVDSADDVLVKAALELFDGAVVEN